MHRIKKVNHFNFDHADLNIIYYESKNIGHLYIEKIA